ncbi:G-type lectin S-receptor-like serine/threonine-protein kinase At4g03230 [Nicotiana sylvestris]|uniref:G-type lectin S-receptor-like serine/threonine-protein kinase At4g03230 n=1 Tax=Nicotiana sylvestris TaxID=4096 RepID=UPI00388CB27B
MSPKYALDGLFSIKSDIFSFGVIMLEIICGKRNTGFYQREEALNFLGYAWRLCNEGNAMSLVDDSLLESCNEEDALKCINIALLCVQEDANIRPSMPDVIIMLGSESISILKPNKPAFTIAIAYPAQFSEDWITFFLDGGLGGTAHTKNEFYLMNRAQRRIP